MTQCRHRRGRTAAALVAAVALSFGAATPALADPTPSLTDSPAPPSPTDFSTATPGRGFTGKWFVELEARPTILGGSAATIEAQQKAFTQALNSSDADVEVEETFGELWTGVVVSADESELAAVKAADHVKAIFPVLTVTHGAETDAPAPSPSSAAPVSSPAPSTSHAATSSSPNVPPTSSRDTAALSASPAAAPSNSDEQEYTGKGVKIGIIDTGVDIDHPAFGGTGVSGTTTFPNAKVVAGYDFVGDDYNDNFGTSHYNPVPSPDPNPDDCNGHGTHVAGIAAGYDPASQIFGVAPEATLGAYRVFGCFGSASSDIILAAMEQAKADGMDVVNMSLGADFTPWPNYPTSVAADNLVKAGIHVVVAQGNQGRDGAFSFGAPASARDVIAVGWADGVPERHSAMRVGGQLYAFQNTMRSPYAPIEGEIELASYPQGQEAGAVDLPGTPFTGKAVLISQGESNYADQVKAATADGAAAIIIHSARDGERIWPDPWGDEWEASLPVLLTSFDTGSQLRSIIKDSGKEPTILTWTDEWALSEPYYERPVLSDQSSWGVSGDLDIKPDIVAQGEFVRSAFPLDGFHHDRPGTAMMSGTSMASPHVAGSVALLLEGKPEFTPAQIKTLLLNHATPVATVDDETKLEPIHHQGAGIIGQIDPGWYVNPAQGSDPDDSPQPFTVSPAKINLGDGDKIETTTLTITNPGDTPTRYFLDFYGNVETMSRSNFSDREFATHDFDGLITFSGEAVSAGNEVQIPAGESRDIQVTIKEPTKYKGDKGAVAPGSMYGGFISVWGFDSSHATVPFFGMTGDYETDRGYLLATYGQLWDQAILDAWGVDRDDIYAPPSLASGCDLTGNCASGYPQPIEEGYIFNVEAGDIPGIALFVVNPLRSLKIEAFHANDDGTKGAPVSDYGPFYTSDGEGAFLGYRLYQWDATVQASDDPADRRLVEPGRYVIEATAIKGMGQATKGPNTESWVSPVFTVETDAPPAQEDVAILDNSWDGSRTKTWPIMHGYQVLTGDWDGDGQDTLMFRNGVNFAYADSLGDESTTFIYGRDGDEVLVGDWDGDGKDTVAVRRGIRIHYTNSLVGGRADASHNFGRLGDKILIGDWDGDGDDTASVHRGKTFFVNNELTATRVAGFIYGRDGDIALAGDWDGDGRDTFSVVRGTTIFVNDTLQGGRMMARDIALEGDAILVGDWDGDGADTLGVVRSSVKG
ncbi:MAG: S8 family serine peptidase [Ancrocorticia sp.]